MSNYEDIEVLEILADVLNKLDRFTAFALIASEQAIEDSKIDLNKID